MTELIVGEVTGEDGDAVNIRAPIPENVEAWGKQRPSKVLLKFCDGRKASPEQVKKAHALISEIAEWMGDTPEFVKIQLKRKFILTKLDEIETGMFSFRDCDMEKARLFITFLIDLMVEYGIPSKRPLWEQCEDIGAYVYACCMNKVCAVCGRHGVDLHHLSGSRAGHGGLKWREKDQTGAVVLPLCREHHRIIHDGEKDFIEKYHLEGVQMTKEIARLYKAKMKDEVKP